MAVRIKKKSRRKLLEELNMNAKKLLKNVYGIKRSYLPDTLSDGEEMYCIAIYNKYVNRWYTLSASYNFIDTMELFDQIKYYQIKSLGQREVEDLELLKLVVDLSKDEIRIEMQIK